MHTGVYFFIYFFVSVQRDAAVSSLYFISLQNLSTRFGCSLRPSSGVLKTAHETGRYLAQGTYRLMTTSYRNLPATSYDLYQWSHMQF
jgi:hypothetical protein